MLHSISTIHISSSFEKSFRKLPRHIQQLSIKKDQVFRLNAYEGSLRTHKLKGHLEGYYSYSVNREYRILFGFIKAHEVIYYDIGTHSIYQK